MGDRPHRRDPQLVGYLLSVLRHGLATALVRLWALPYTVLGLAIGCILLGRPQWVEGVLEIHGRWVAAALARLPTPALAITLGHTVLGQSPAALAATRRHERVHVRQYERWGPIMGPAYLLASAYLWCRGRDPYRDNPFEVEAFRESP